MFQPVNDRISDSKRKRTSKKQKSKKKIDNTIAEKFKKELNEPLKSKVHLLRLHFAFDINDKSSEMVLKNDTVSLFLYAPDFFDLLKPFADELKFSTNFKNVQIQNRAEEDERKRKRRKIAERIITENKEDESGLPVLFFVLLLF